MIKEWLARGIIILGLVLVISIPATNKWQQSQGIVIHARMAETGGWTPENLTVAVGVPLHLRLTSDDVTHGFAVGQLDQPAVDINPGEMTDINLVFTKPGKYTFYCTRWCSVNHWRMRGTIEVTDPNTKAEPAKPPLYVTLGLNIDADHKASLTPAQIPSTWRGALLNQNIPITYKGYEYYLSHTPLDLWLALRSEPAFKKLNDQDVWDLVAWAWQSNSSPEEVQAGKQLFAANCAACHGESGAGNGVFADLLAAGSGNSALNQSMGEQTQRPANFTDALRMLSASPAHLQGKIIRGGMGTGMPSWGAIFTEDQTWALVAYLWTFQYQSEVHP
jgi:mono/diheme cytochrome c family protein/plastocyanin